MQPKKASETAMVMAIQMMPGDANPSGNVHGGVIMKHIDTTAGVVALRHAGKRAVTASIDRLDFFHPVFVGNVLVLRASLNMTGKTSMEIGVRVEAEEPRTGEVRHTASAYLTFVALDDDGSPSQVPQLVVETSEEKRRHEEAEQRRKQRLAEKAREKASKKASG